jgi:hypothetical protein
MAAALVYPQGVLVVTERPMLVLQVRSIPIERMIQTFLPKSSDEPFDERMRNRDIQHGRDRFDTQDPQVGLPAVELKEGIVVEPRAKALALTRDSLVEEATQSRGIDGDPLHSKADEPAAELVHQD